jgi:hypothetical protein
MDAPPDLRIMPDCAGGGIYTLPLFRRNLDFIPLQENGENPQISLLQHTKTDMDQSVALVPR